MITAGSLYLRIARSLASRVRIEGIEQLPAAGPYVIAANHQSYFDPPLLAAVIASATGLKPRFLTTLYVWNFLRRFSGVRGVNWIGMLPVDEANPGEALKPATNFLLQHGIIGIFPESRRNNQPVLARGKTGAVRLALATPCPVVPVGIVLKSTGPRFFLAWLLGRAQARIIIGAPVTFTDQATRPVTKLLLDELTATLMRRISALCHKPYQPDRP